MRLVHALGAAVAATTLVGSVAQATITINVVPVPVITSAARTADPVLNNARSYDLFVTQTGNDKWDVTSLQAALFQGSGLSGTYYAPANHSDIYIASPATANLNFDTSFTSPRWEQTSDITHLDLLGKSDYPVNTGSGAYVGAATAPGNTLNISWGDKRGNDVGTTNADGTYRVARLTVVGNTGANIQGYNAGTASVNTPQKYSVYLPMAGDTNHDGVVASDDFDAWFTHFGNVGSNLHYLGDNNQDGVVASDDFDVWFLNFGHVAPTAPALPGASLGTLVPEPTSLALLSLAGLAVAGRRRRA